MGFEPELFIGRPCDLPGCAASTNPSVSFARWFSQTSTDRGGVHDDESRSALDVHRDFCEVAICEDGEVRSAGRVKTTPEELELFAQSLGARRPGGARGDGQRLGGRADPRAARRPGGGRQPGRHRDRARRARRPTGSTPARWRGCWPRASSRRSGCPTSATRALRRRLARRAQLVRVADAGKERDPRGADAQPAGAPPVRDLFGVKGRRSGLAGLELPVEERETVDGCLRQIDFLDAEIAAVERVIARQALDSAEIRRLMTVPGVNLISAATFVAAVGDIGRFSDRREAGRLPRARPEGAPVRRGARAPRPDLKAGLGAARHALCRGGLDRGAAARARCAPSMSACAPAAATQVAIVATARKLACLFWCMLTRGEDYAYEQPSLTRKKLRRLELTAGDPEGQGRPGLWATNAAMRTPSASSPRRPRSPTSARSPTGSPGRRRRVRVRHRGAHLRQAARQGSAPEPAL